MGKAKEAARTAMKDYTLGYELPRLYRQACAQPVGPRSALFVNVKQANVADAFDVIMPHLRDRYGFDVRFVGLNQAGTSFSRYHANCREFVKRAATAELIFLEDASDVVSCLPLRPETRVVQLWHGCGAFKKWGRSVAEKKFGPSAVQSRRHPFYGNLNLVTVSSPEVEWAYHEAMGIDADSGIVRATGVSRTDVFFDGGFRLNASLRLRKAVPQIGDRKVILYAPTFRGPVKQAKGPDALDVRAMKEALGEGYFLVVKHHPFVQDPPSIPPDCRDFAALLDAPGRLHTAMPTDALLCAADVLVTDYSSVIFEYSLLERPMVFFAYDYADYCDWRGFYYDYDEMTPGPVVANAGDLLEAISTITDWFDGSAVQAFREKFMASCDGHSTERICKVLFGDAFCTDRAVGPTAGNHV